MARSARSDPHRFHVVGTGWVPCNKWRWKKARLVLYRPGCGMVSIAFGIGKYKEHDSFVKVDELRKDHVSDIGSNTADGESWAGIAFWSCGVMRVGYDKKDYPSGDLRDMLPMILKSIGWPTDNKRYLLIGMSGEFWSRPAPMHSPKETNGD